MRPSAWWWCLMAVLAIPQPGVKAGEPEFVERELLIKVVGGPLGHRAGEINAQMGSVVLHRFPRVGWQHLQLPEGMAVEEGRSRYLRIPGVLAAEPNRFFSLADTDDPVLDDPRIPDQWSLEKIDANTAWSFSTGSTEIVVALIDSGVNYTHPDLAANMWRNPGETGSDSNGNDRADNGIDDDANGYADDVHGIDTLRNDTDPRDERGHGTKMCGILGAVGGNGIGVSGVCPQTRIMTLGVDNEVVSKVLECFEYVMMMKDRGIDIRVTSNSYGIPAYDQAVKDAIDAAGAVGILNVFPAGNSPENKDINPLYPACFDSPSIVAVTSTSVDTPTGEEEFHTWRAWGPVSIDLAAPGYQILSTTMEGGYGLAGGTSSAVPHISGAAALLWSVVPDASAAEIKAAILNSVDRLPSLEGKVATGGRLNLGRAVRLLAARDAPPALLTSFPSSTGSDPVSMVRLHFSKSMDRASAEAGFSTSPELPGAIEWSNADHVMTFRPNTPWLALGSLTFRLSGDVLDAAGASVDGNANLTGEGSPIDDYTWSYQLETPVLTSFEPAQGNAGTQVALFGTGLDLVATVRFDGVEATFSPNRRVPGSLMARVPQYATTGPLTLESPVGATTHETAFVVELPQHPPLDCHPESGSLFSLTWPTATRTRLESTVALSPAVWMPVEAAPVVTAEQFRLTIPFADDLRFYRLSQPD